jgi:hypothetical protein
MFDRGYYKYYNYVLGIIRYRIVPFIFPKKNFNLKGVLNRMTYLFLFISMVSYHRILKNFFRD